MSSKKFVVSAPTRADLAGGTLDLWPLYCLFGSAKTLNVSITLKAVCTFDYQESSTRLIIIENSQGKTFSFSENLSENALDSVPKEVKFPVAIVSRFLSQVPIKENFNLKIKIETQAPLGSGLGGSSTLCVALLKGLGHLTGQFQSSDWKWKIMEWARDVEAQYLKTPTGTQDYLGAIFGSLSCFSYDLGQLSHRPYSPKVVEELESRMLVLFSGEMHHSGLSNWEVFKKAMEGDAKVFSGLKNIKDIADILDYELSQTVLDWKNVGVLLSNEWKTRKETLGVHTERLDQIITFLNLQDVIGVKVCGAAQGGSLLVLTEPNQKKSVAEACQNHGIQVLPTQISSSGVDIKEITS